MRWLLAIGTASVVGMLAYGAGLPYPLVYFLRSVARYVVGHG